ncbi:MAG: cation:dicarboxylate symporter family transporter [Sediminibacterium sp.]
MSLVYFEIVSTLSLAIGLVVALWIQPGNIDKTGLQMQDPAKYTSNTNFDLWGIVASNTNLQVLILAIFVGFLLNYLPKREQYLHQIGRLTHFVFLGLKWVMYFAPLGALGGMSYAIGKCGLATLLPLGKLMITMYLTMALFVFVILASTLATMQKIPIEGLAFLLSVDKFMSEARAITNIIGNSAATIVITKTERETIHL